MTTTDVLIDTVVMLGLFAAYMAGGIAMSLVAVKCWMDWKDKHR